MPTVTTATSGERATAKAYGAGDLMSSAARAIQAMILITPSEPITNAYERNRPTPAHTPRAKWAGA
jgi:hypothetical protein